MFKHIAITFVLLIPGVLPLFAASKCKPGERAVSGQVLKFKNSKYEPLNGVTITLERGSETPKTATSLADGSYEVCFSEGPSIDTLTYEMVGQNPNHIADLSGARHHNVNITLKPEGTSTLEALQVLSTLERLYFIYRARSEQDKLKDRYLLLLKRLDVKAAQPDLDKHLQARLRSLRVLYGL